MKRREWIRNTALASGAVFLPGLDVNRLFPETKTTVENEIEEIHLINMSHTDFGYTDLSPSKLVVRQVIDLGSAGEMIEPIEGDEIWAYPCK